MFKQLLLSILKVDTDVLISICHVFFIISLGRIHFLWAGPPFLILPLTAYLNSYDLVTELINEKIVVQPVDNLEMLKGPNRHLNSIKSQDQVSCEAVTLQTQRP